MNVDGAAAPNGEQGSYQSPGASASTGGLFAPGLLSGRAALVTGGGTGIGYGIAGCLAAAGASVAIASRDLERLEAAAGRLREAHGVPVVPLRANVRERDSVREAVRRTAEELGGLDILVNNAAGNFLVDSAELSPNGWAAVVETDLYGTFYGCQAAFPLMKKAGGGRIVSISMTLHHRGWPRMAHACAAKGGVDALTRALALEWGRHGITVNAVAPGPVPTEGVRRAFARDDASDADPDRGAGPVREGDGGPEEGAGRGGGAAGDDGEPDLFSGPRAARAYARRFIPAGRPGRPEDIGHMVTYLASPAGEWITGAVLVVDGGESLASPRSLSGP